MNPADDHFGGTPPPIVRYSAARPRVRPRVLRAHLYRTRAARGEAEPCIWTRNSVLMRRADSDSVSERVPHSESTSSMKMMVGLLSRAISNRLLTSLRTRRRGTMTGRDDGARWQGTMTGHDDLERRRWGAMTRNDSGARWRGTTTGHDDGERLLVEPVSNRLQLIIINTFM